MNDLVPQPDPPEQTHDAILALVKTLTDAQTKDSEVRTHELEIRSEEIASNERIAMKSIEVQERFHANHREQYNKHLIHRYTFVIIALLVIFAFAITMVMNGAKDIILEAFKIFIAFAAGGYGGFQAGKNKKGSDE